MGQISTLLKAVIATSLSMQALLAAMFLPRFLAMGFDPVRAIWDAVFMAISVFNNAGFVILPDGLAPHVTDWWMLIPIILGTTVGAIGFPVIMDVAKHLRTPRRWRLHTKLTLSTYLILAFVGALAMALTEWHNPTTLGAIDTPSKILNAMLAGVNSRSSGLSALDVGAMHSQTHFVQDILMMIGGGSASTAGGVKVTTFAVLVLAVIAEARGDRDIETFGRRIPTSTIRLSVAVSLLGLALVAISVVLLLSMTDYTLDIILLETVSAFATVGLSTGITPILPVGAKYVLIFLMFAGRTGSMTVAAALALPLAWALHHCRLFSRATLPYVAASQAVPAIAIAPLLVLWIGYGTLPVVILCAFMVFFPITVTVLLGLRGLDTDVIDAARLDGAHGTSMLVYMELPMTLPAVLTGLRTGFTLSITGAVVGEMTMGGTGLGLLLSSQRDAVDTTGLFSTITLLCTLATTIHWALTELEHRSRTVSALRGRRAT